MNMHSSDRSDLTIEELEVVGKPGDLVSEDAVPARPRSSTVMVSLRMDRRTFDGLSRLAEQQGGTFSRTVREALRAYLQDLVGNQPYPEASPSPTRRASDNAITYTRDEDLRSALHRYEAACRSAGMREKAWRSYVDYARRFLAWREGEYQPRGTAAGDRPVPRTRATIADLRDQAKQYADEVRAAGRARPTVDTYLRHALFFIRWLEGDFDPGARLRGLR